MLIRELLQSKPLTFSCELFPPKAGADLARADEVVEQTARLAPDFISVTYGASGNTSHNTLRMARHIEEQNCTALAHLTCVSATRADIGVRLDAMLESGVQNVLALRGDLPEGETRPQDACFQHADALVREIRTHGGFCVGGACYPEGHVESASQEEDIAYLKQKVEAGCDFLTTQMFFDNNVLYRFLYKLYAKGIAIPVLAGIMPVTNKKQIARIVRLSGTSLPPRFQNILDRFGGDSASMEEAGIAYATEQIIDLVANGVRGVHLYTMNRPDISGRIMANLCHILGKTE